MKKITHAILKAKMLRGELSICVDVWFDNKPLSSEPKNYIVMYDDNMKFMQHLHYTQKETNDDYSRTKNKGIHDYFTTGPLGFWGKLLTTDDGIEISPAVLFIKQGVKNGYSTEFIGLNLSEDIQKIIDKEIAVSNSKKEDNNNSFYW